MEGALITLALLACPIGMGLMMWFMARGKRGGTGDNGSSERPDGGALAALKAEQARLGVEIDRLEAEADVRDRVASGSHKGS